jgi:hypothetical protein
MKIDLFVRAVHEPEKIKVKNGQQRYISRICGGGTPKGGELKTWRICRTRGRNQPDQFLSRSDEVFGLAGVKNEDLPLKGKWLLQHCLAFPRWHVIEKALSVLLAEKIWHQPQTSEHGNATKAEKVSRM